MATKKQVEQALVNMNHATTAIQKTLAVQGTQHIDMLGELKRSNDITNKNNENNHKLLNTLIKGILRITVVALIAAFGLKVGGLI